MVRILFTDPTETYQHNDEELVEGIRTLIRKARSTISIHGYSLKGFQERDLFDHELISKLKSGVSLKIYGDSKDEVEFVCSIYRMYDVEVFHLFTDLRRAMGSTHQGRGCRRIPYVLGFCKSVHNWICTTVQKSGSSLKEIKYQKNWKIMSNISRVLG